MKIFVRVAVCAVGLLCAGSMAREAEDKEDVKDAVGAAPAAVAPPAVPGAGALPKPEALRPRVSRLPAEALGPTVLWHDSQKSANDNVRIKLNSSRDHVLVEFTNCRTFAFHQPCDSIGFLFPQLTVDPDGKFVLLGDDIVGTVGWFGSVQLTNGYQLHAEKLIMGAEPDLVTGPQVKVAVFLEKE